MDDVFGENCFVNIITIKTKVAGVSGSHLGKSLQNNEEYILIEDTYTPNYYAIGSYTITYELTDSTIIKLIVKTYNEMISIKEVNKEETKTILKKETFFTKIKSFFLKIISFFKNLLNFINIYLLLK